MTGESAGGNLAALVASPPVTGTGRIRPGPPTLRGGRGQDPLRVDALRYADALEAVGVEVRRVVYPEAIHGFASTPLFEPAARAALDEVVAELGERPRVGAANPSRRVTRRDTTR